MAADDKTTAPGPSDDSPQAVILADPGHLADRGLPRPRRCCRPSPRRPARAPGQDRRLHRDAAIGSVSMSSMARPAPSTRATSATSRSASCSSASVKVRVSWSASVEIIAAPPYGRDRRLRRSGRCSAERSSHHAYDAPTLETSAMRAWTRDRSWAPPRPLRLLGVRRASATWPRGRALAQPAGGGPRRMSARCSSTDAGVSPRHQVAGPGEPGDDDGLVEVEVHGDVERPDGRPGLADGADRRGHVRPHRGPVLLHVLGHQVYAVPGHCPRERRGASASPWRTRSATAAAGAAWAAGRVRRAGSGGLEGHWLAPPTAG